MKSKKIARGFAVIITVLTFFIGCFAAAFMLVAVGYMISGHEITGHHSKIYLYISLPLGVSFAYLIWWYLAKRDIAQYTGAFKPIIEVMEKISKGDFHVRLDHNIKIDEYFAELVKSVNSMASDLDRMEKMRQEFISNVSHEIQSPLSSIRGFARVLRNDNLSPDERLHYLGIIEAESMRLSMLSDNLLKLASLEAKSIKVCPKSYRLDKQIRNIILACEPQWLDKGIDMEVFLDEINIKADENLLSQVWINLIHNSIKFTPRGGSIKVNLHMKDDKIKFKITDTGIGISQEDQIHIFERFYKADKSRERSNKGSGLGLSIVRKIIDIHHGTISVQSRLGECTTFIVILPEG